MSFSISRARSLAAVAFLLVPSLAMSPSARGSDHVDAADNVNRLGADLTDLYIFPSPTNANNVVLAMDLWSLIPAGQRRSFDPNVLYQFKFDTTGDAVEDLVIQAKFDGLGTNQRVRIAGPMRPQRTGAISTFTVSQPTVGVVDTIFSPTPGMTVFAGTRADPFVLDFEQFITIFPDRGTPITTKLAEGASRQVETPDPNRPRVNGFRNPGVDFFANLNILSIVIELPRASLGGGIIRTWMTASVATGGNSFRQQERLARPLINEALVTVTNRRSEINNKALPTDDDEILINDLRSFLNFPAERSEAIQNVILSILVPDVMIADLRQAGPAAYLGVETNGATGGRFGGRKLTDDAVDADLMVVFGTLISDLGLAPPDGRQKPQFASDNVGVDPSEFLPNFPFLGNPK